ncbi:Hpt domain-containing protein [Hylemonella gracilis]|uniref:CheA signal transduction histidine kinase n=1 Tax=Hylemonella gracilis ATCC 19624 TaxID=887062 RepID=F3KUC7_9BURK|nr:Hpt domain-containing protein [Hylemonella gracilis]EGI76677.1 CheA signal transduction histidine kinase [Hylemonella gracilis ATCC 19624]
MPPIPSAVLQEELRVTLDATGRSLRRLLHERAAGGATGTGLAPEVASLPEVRDRLLRCATALEPFSGSAKLLYAMASLVQSHAAHPQSLSEASAAAVERASDAVIEHLAALARGKQVSAVALFPQYRELLMLLGEERVHPAELWTPPASTARPAPAVEFPLEGAPASARSPVGAQQAWAWIDGTRADKAARAALKAEPLAYAPALRSRMDVALLQMVKAGGGAAALPLRDIALGLAAGETPLPRRAFWQLASAYFEALALELIAADVYVKRTASRVLLQYSAFSRQLSGAEVEVADGLAQDLLFFCAQAAPPNLLTAAQAAPVLATVRRIYGLDDAQPVNYEAQRYGRFDPTALAQARQRIRAALEGWAGFNTEPDLLYPNSIPDSHRFEALTALFSQLGVSLLTLQPERRELVRALLQAADYIARAASWRPSLSGARLATEVDLALCFLDAAYEDLDPAEDMLKQERGDLLALRIDRAVDAAESGLDEPAEPFQPWMAELLGLPAPTESVFQPLFELEHEGHPFRVSAPNPPPATPPVPLHVQPAWAPEPPPVLESLAQAEPRVDVAPDATGSDGGHGGHGSDGGHLSEGLSSEPPSDEPPMPWAPAVRSEAPPPQTVDPQGADGEAGEADPAADVDAESTATLPRATLPVLTQPADDQVRHDAFLTTAREAVHAGLDVVAGQLAGMFDTAPEAALATPDEGEGPLAQVFAQLAEAAAREQAAGLSQAGELVEAVDVLLPFLSATDGTSARPEVLHLALEALHQIGLWVEDLAAGRDPEPLADTLRQAAAALSPQASVLTDTTTSTSASAASNAPADPFPGAPSDEPPRDLSALVSLADSADPSMAVPIPQPIPQPEPGPEALQPAPDVPASAPDGSAAVVTVQAAGEYLTIPAEPPPFRQTRFVEAEAQFKQIGPLRLPLADYKAFLSEAAEWSRLLSAGLNEWSLDLRHQVRRALPVNLLALAHALAGSAAALGLEAIATLSRTLEQAMMQLRGERELQVPASEAARIFLLAAEDIRYLLHRLAAGELKMPEPGLLDELAAAAGIEAPVLHAPVSPSAIAATGTADAEAQSGPQGLTPDEPDLFTSAAPAATAPRAPVHNEWGYDSLPEAASYIDPPRPLTLRQRLEARVDEVHGGLHELDLMLERLRTYLKSAGLPPEALKEIATVQRHLQEALGELEEDLRELDDESGP